MSKHVERDKVLGHEDEADGIQEYDNPLPDWWLGLFWATTIFGIAYGVHYHFIAHRSPQQALARELAEARERWPAPAQAAGAPFVVTEETAAAGGTIFATNCAPCHGANKNLQRRGKAVQEMILKANLPTDLVQSITEAYAELGKIFGKDPDVAVRSSATAEDLPGASFAGQQETYLNVQATQHCWKAANDASLRFLPTGRSPTARTRDSTTSKSACRLASSAWCVPILRRRA